MCIAIYGLSTETEKAISELKGNNEIVGLLDGFKTEGELYGYPIITLERAIAASVERIIVVARPGSCKAIAKRIGDVCKANHIELIDIRGKDLLHDSEIVYDLKLVEGYKYEAILDKIKRVDAVSFDLFDTLVVRNTYLSQDIIELVESRLEEDGIEIEDFVSKRISAEKSLSQGGKAIKLVDIYLEICGDRQLAERLACKEFEIDLSTLSPRKDVVRLLYDAKCIGKRIFMTSDTYYSYEQINKLLARNQIEGFDALIISCEKGTSKTGELFEVLKQKSDTDSILHIGDDIVSDIEHAKYHGIEGFKIYSSIELFDMVGGFGLEKYTKCLSDRIRVGMFAATIFNSPFQFEDDERKIHIDSANNIGYLSCAPMIMDFVIWLIQQVKSDRFSDVLLGARDGYLIKKIYELLPFSKHAKYYLTSRISAVRTGVSTEEDIAYVDGMRFAGTTEECLKRRFGISAQFIDKDDAQKQGLMAYSKSILEVVKQKKHNNLKYIESLCLGDGNVAFFDFVAKGTCQMYTQKLIKNHICGFYFLQLEPEYMKEKNLEIIPFYTEQERSDSAIFENYYILETILTSPDPSVEEFDGDGKPLYAKETRTQMDIECVMDVQRGIVEYVKQYLELCPKNERVINKKLDEVFLQLLRNIEITDMKFLNLTVEDPFFNRMTEIKTVL